MTAESKELEMKGRRNRSDSHSQKLRWSGIVLGLVALAGAECHAAISKPDAVLYGSARLGGVPATGSVVSVRKAGVALEEYTVGSAGPADFYAIRIPVVQQADGEARQATEVYEGDTVQLCAGGSKSGMECVLDSDCPGGICVVARGVCDGGAGDGTSCECIGETTC